MAVKLYQGDCLEILPTLEAGSVHAVITDPPYCLTSGKKGGSGPASLNLNSPAGRARISTGFMGKSWDNDIALRSETWREVLRVMKPGAHLLAFGGTRTSHRMACAIEDAGFEIRTTMMWVFASGMAKGINVGKALGKAYSDDLAAPWVGWHSEIKPAYEPVICARVPLIGTVAENCLVHGVGALNIDASRIPIDPDIDDPRLGGKGEWSTVGMAKNVYGDWAGVNSQSSELGRFPSNLIHDGSDEVEEAFAIYGKKTSGRPGIRRKAHETHSMSGRLNRTGETETGYADSGSASRFFKSCPWSDEETANRIAYFAKASEKDRAGSHHPTVKPLSLMRYLCKLITPAGGTILDCFAGSGTTGQAAVESGFNDVILIEREREYCEDIKRRLSLFMN
jgi:site-specific DNA-methyltransferase (adenine-specific)